MIFQFENFFRLSYVPFFVSGMYMVGNMSFVDINWYGNFYPKVSSQHTTLSSVPIKSRICFLDSNVIKFCGYHPQDMLYSPKPLTMWTR